MSYGTVICSTCKREVHQSRNTSTDRLYWFHCEDESDICRDSTATYPMSIAEIVGKWCGRDAMGGGL